MSDYIEIKNGDITCFTSKYQTTPQFELPHSCDEWVIGDLEDAKEFVKDLQKTIAELEVILAPNQPTKADKENDK